MNKQEAFGYSSGRVVLVGEHSVVYGEPALVSSVGLGVRVRVSRGSGEEIEKRNKYLSLFAKTFEEETGKSLKGLSVDISADLPQKRGLSSSSALACGMYRALDDWFELGFDKDRLFELVLAAERKIYPVSGMDQAAVVYGGVFRFQRVDGELVREVVPVGAFEGMRLVLIDSGRPVESTALMVAQVSEKRKVKNEKYKKIIGEMGRVAEEFVDKVKEGRFEPELMKENERLLEELGVVGERAKQMVRKVEGVGGVAKISGAGGGKKGSGMLVSWHRNVEKVVDLCRERRWKCWEVGVGKE